MGRCSAGEIEGGTRVNRWRREGTATQRSKWSGRRRGTSKEDGARRRRGDAGTKGMNREGIHEQTKCHQGYQEHRELGGSWGGGEWGGLWRCFQGR